MAKLILEGPQPIDLVAKNHPTSTAERGIVMMTLPVYDPQNPEDVVQIRIQMTPDDAEYASHQLGPAVMTARVQLKNWR